MSVSSGERARIVACAGGAANVSREREVGGELRLTLKDRGLADVAAIEALGCVESVRLQNATLVVTLAGGDTSANESQVATGSLPVATVDVNETQMLARAILAAVGGKANVRGITRCVTRLRFMLANDRAADVPALEALDGVVEVIRAGGQLQLVVGAAVDDLYDELVGDCGLSELSGESAAVGEGDEKPASSLAGRMAAAVTACLGPLTAMLCAAGTVKGLLVLLVALGLPDAVGGVYQVLGALADACFCFLPVLVGYTSAKAFGLSRPMGLALGALFMYPELEGIDPGLEAIVPAAGYAGSALPVIVSVWLAARLERFLSGVVPQLVRALAVPALCIVVMAPLSLVVVGPSMSLVARLLATLVENICNASPWGGALLGLAFGGLWSTLVTYGLQSVAVLVMLNNLVLLGWDPMGTVIALGGFVGVGQGLCAWLLASDDGERGSIRSAVASQVVGVGEPLLYGFQLRHRPLFVQGAALSGLGGAVAGALGIRAYTLGAAGVFCFPVYVDPLVPSLTGLLVMLGITVALVLAGFVLAYVTRRIWREVR